MDIVQLSHYLDDLLDVHSIKDFPNALNGMQMENTGDIKKVGLAVDHCLETLRMAVKQNCNLMLVHHGMFWEGLKPIRGPHYEKIRMMAEANMGLYASHLPLDKHPVLGNNRALTDMIALGEIKEFSMCKGQTIGLYGVLPDEISSVDLGLVLADKLSGEVQVIGERKIKTVGVVSGGAGDYIKDAIDLGLDCFITGEGQNHLYHIARESDCALILAGHYKTETGGVKALGKHLADRFGLECVFLDHPTGL